MGNKKILFSAYSLDLGGIETALISLINYLAQKEYDITLVLEKKQGIFLNKLNENIKVIEYKPSYCKLKIISKLVNTFKRIKFIAKYKNKFDFSCSYATYCQMASFVARTASENNALWVHNNYFEFFNKNEQEYKSFFSKIQSSEFKNIVFVSNESKEQYIDKIGNTNNNLIVCNNLIDYKKIQSLSNEKIELKKEENVITFLNVGRHDEKQKKLTRLFNAAKKLVEENLQFRIILVGEGEETENYKKIVESYNLNDKVIFIGKTTNPYPYYKIADSIILTSEFEGYPVVYIEAQILEKPIITTNVSDSELEINNKYGIVINKDDESIYNAMKEFIKNKFIIKEKFQPEKYNEDIIKKVEEMIKG